MDYPSVPLDQNSEPGLFLTDESVAYWIVQAHSGLFAVQLDNSGAAPAYSCHKLKSKAHATGKHFGRVELRVFMAAPPDAYDASGTIVVDSSGTKLIARGRGGLEELVLRQSSNSMLQTEPKFYPLWALEAHEPFFLSYHNLLASAALDLSMKGNSAAAAVLGESKIIQLRG